MGVVNEKKGANKPREGEGIGRSKLGEMRIMREWMEDGTHLGIGVKLTTSFLLGACWDS
jgi:hypothetical protein